MNRIFIIAGEASGDLHGSNLCKSIRSQNRDVDIVGWGGDMMMAAGVQVTKHIKELAFMGFSEVLKHLPEIMSNFKLCKKEITEFNPDVVLFVDYPGFNLRMAKWAKKNGYKTCYYISPQIWAWKENRVHTIKKYVDEMICILPFEPDFYRRHDMTVDYVGHPLLQVIDDEKQKPIKAISDKKIIALLPGSRKQEVITNLPIMLESCRNLVSDYSLVIAQSPTLDIQIYNSIIQNFPDVMCLQNQTYSILRQAKAALVTSGTATLETALFDVPQIVCYRGPAMSVWLARRLIKVKYIALANLILDRESIPELIQNDFNPITIDEKLQFLLDSNSAVTIQMKKDYKEVREKLELDAGEASDLAAKLVWDLVKF